MTPLRFIVYGEAKPAGSKRAFVNPKTGRAIVTDHSGKAGKSWRVDVKDAAREAMDGRDPFTGPLTMSLTFYRQRPKGHYGTGKNAERVKDSAPEFPETRPDVLKLARAVEDALTGIAYRDDAQIVNEHLYKRFGEPGCVVEIRPA